jgi:hypothetical protein
LVTRNCSLSIEFEQVGSELLTFGAGAGVGAGSALHPNKNIVKIIAIKLNRFFILAPVE